MGAGRVSATVLLVEDDGYMRRAVQRQLSAHGYGVITAASAVEALAAEAADVGVFDVDLPGMDGARLAERLLQLGRVRHALFFTSVTDPVVRARAAKLGMVLDKSNGVAALLAELAAITAP
jgi:two-component system phosphate regulon response regulator OmpR